MIFLRINLPLDCISLQACMGERYCITVLPYDIIWGNGVPPTKYLGERRSTTPLRLHH